MTAGKLLLILAVFAASVSYIKSHTNVQVTERQSAVPLPGNEEEIYGIGFGPEEKLLFWFHQKTETQ